MSNSHLFLKSGFIQSTLGNGIGRYVCQLQRLTFKFCKSTGTSKGVRDFIQTELLDYAKVNPGVVIYLKPRRHKSPHVVAEYLNGHREVIQLDEFSRDDVYQWTEYLRMREGAPPMRLIKNQKTEHPSIQGPWTPFTHQAPEMNVTSFPSEAVGTAQNLGPTATEIVLELRAQAAENQPKLQES